jgi:hypothetical protein
MALKCQILSLLKTIAVTYNFITIKNNNMKQFNSKTEQLEDALTMSVDIIKRLIASKPVRNLDESLAYFEGLIKPKELPQDNLNELLEPMDIPSLRRDITKEENLRWLSRNLAIRNSSHKNFKPAIEKITYLILGSCC